VQDGDLGPAAHEGQRDWAVAGLVRLEALDADLGRRSGRALAQRERREQDDDEERSNGAARSGAKWG